MHMIWYILFTTWHPMIYVQFSSLGKDTFPDDPPVANILIFEPFLYVKSLQTKTQN
jgi:hypothetical protein